MRPLVPPEPATTKIAVDAPTETRWAARNPEGARDLAHVLRAMDIRLWMVVLLHPNSKIPAAITGTWPLTRDTGFIKWWVIEQGGNIALLAGEATGLAIFDIDNLEAFASLEMELGPLGPPTVVTASGKRHIYLAWEPGIPATLVTPRGIVVGEPRRGGVIMNQNPPPLQDAVCPPSRRIVQGAAASYRLLDVDLTRPLPSIPPSWRAYFRRSVPPRAAAPVPPADADARFAAACRQPGAQRRGPDGREMKFQCPACRALGRDTSRDNARLFSNGSWGCAVFPKGVRGSWTHWIAIGVALGAITRTAAAVLGQRDGDG